MTLPSSITCVIRTHNSAKTLPQLLLRLKLEALDKIFIVDSGSTDSTREIALCFSAHFFSLKTPFHYSKALNFGFSQARSPWVLVISSHCIPLRLDLIQTVHSFIREADTSCVVGFGQLGVSPPSDPIPLMLGDRFAFESGRFHPGGNGLAVYRRTAWEAHPFDENIDTAEDLEWFLWAMRQDFTARFIPGVTAIYLNQGSLRHMFRKGWREVRRTRILLPDSRKSVVGASSGLFVGFAYYFWLALRLKIPVGTMFRQCAHALGAFLAEFFPLKPQAPSKVEKILR